MNRDLILSTAAELINGERDRVYGSARDNFTRIAQLWSPILGIPITASQVAILMSQVKIARLVNSPDHEDSWVDGAAYLALGGEIATEKPESADVLVARSLAALEAAVTQARAATADKSVPQDATCSELRAACAAGALTTADGGAEAA